MLLDFSVITNKIQDIIRLNNPGRSKAMAIEAWTGPEGSRRLEFP
jgi:hypothetical protein